MTVMLAPPWAVMKIDPGGLLLPVNRELGSSAQVMHLNASLNPLNPYPELGIFRLAGKISGEVSTLVI